MPEPMETEEIVVSENTTDPSKHVDTQSSDSESESDSEAESQDVLELQTLEPELQRNPSNYEAHLKYIKLLRKMGEIDKLRQARESMSAIYPLTPTMWQEWAKDETTLSSGPDAVSTIEKLYERGVSDYLSVPLWCDYLNFVQEHDPSIRECSSAGISKARDLFERALTAGGLHFSEGSKIWEAYREFEQAICFTIDDSDTEGKDKQIQRVRSIFHRQLCVPLSDMNSSLLAYKVWEAELGNDLDVNSNDLEGMPSHIAASYKKALELCNARSSLEELISKSDVPDPERHPHFKKYLKFEESSGDPARVQILYERAITEFPIYSDLWIDYTRYLEKTLKVGNVLNNVINRATRNCPWVGELWVRHLLCLERVRASEDDISSVFEKALQCSFLSYEEYLDLFLTRIDGLRRRIIGAGEMQVLDYAVIRDTFQRASDYLSSQLKGTDALLQLYAYWARLELTLAKDIVAARGVWESLVKMSGTMLEAWKGYIKMEIDMGNLIEARSIYRRCYTKRFPGSGSEDICHAWLRFEREFGTLEDYDYAVQKVSPRLQELQMFNLQQDYKTSTIVGDGGEHPSKKNSREKRKPISNLSEEQSPSKRHKDMKEVSRKSSKKDHDKETNVSTTQETEKAKNNNELPKEHKKHEKPKFTDQCTAFISNLDLNANYDDLHKFFSEVGGVQSIRILRHRDTGKSRGLAYVDFCDDAHLEAAVKMNKKFLLKKKVSIARSDPSKSKSQSGSKTQFGDQARNMRNNSSELLGGKSSSSKGLNSDGTQLRKKNVFLPRNVKLGSGNSSSEPKALEGGEDDKPKSNDEFREMLVKK